MSHLELINNIAFTGFLIAVCIIMICGAIVFVREIIKKG
jgi:hypothetical protein